MSSSFTHTVAHVRISFERRSDVEYSYIVCIVHLLLIDPSILGCFLLVFVTSAAVFMGVPLPFKTVIKRHVNFYWLYNIFLYYDVVFI